MIGSTGTDFLIKNLKTKFYFIILDTPSVMLATDALLIPPGTDGPILVIIKSGHTEKKKVIKGVIESFQSEKQPILGVVLNQVDLKKKGYYYYYKKYYSSYYAE